MNQVAEELYFGQWLVLNKNLSSQCNLTVQIEQV